MANKDDYLTTYREFFEYFAQTVNPNDQLPVKLGCYKLLNVEVIGGIIDWTTQYLAQKKCPPYLFAPLIKIVIEEIRKACKKQPLNYGFSSTDNAYEPLKLMQAVMAKTNEVCLRYLDNSILCSLPIPSSFYFQTSICAVRNRRRKMEDRHVAIHDLNTMFNIQEASPSSYYAIFDGHAGHDAAAYSAAHLHQFLAENKYFISNPEQALLDAFCKTDALFLEKCKVENLSGGTTAVVALLRPKERTLYIAWVGDSQALLVKQGKVLQCVNPHKPCREDERERIEKAGGSVMLWGTWRVNGQLAVSRAIGDADYKPHVIAIPDVREISLDGEEDFLIIACDGLWDFLTEDVAAQEVYYMIAENPDDTERISTHLVQLARYQGSTDNISVIVVFLREPHQISAEAHRWATTKGPTLAASNMETGLDNANNPFNNSNGSLKNLNVDSDNINIPKAGDGLLLDLTDNFKQNRTDVFVPEKSNGTKMSSPDIHFDDDFGPETDVDAVDEAYSLLDKDKDFSDGLSKVLKDESNLKSIKNEAKALTEELANNNPLCDESNPFLTCQKNENINEDSKEVDFEEGNRGETPTQSADTAGHDAGGLEVVGESDSEDEWNYIKGDQAKPETLSSQPETVVEVSEQDDTMSQLNPNAAEFVPISPTRSIPSPACRALLNDEIISESPKRPLRVDIKVPSEVEFESEVKSRPSDFNKNGVDDDIDNGVEENGKIENLLNGKNIDEIPEFHPGSTPTKLPSEEFHFGPNAAPFTPRVLDQSEAFSTKANYGDDTEQTLNTSFNDSELGVQNKEQTDPMSMSFYAEKGESNPFQDDEDLNKVHRLPENIDDFLQEHIDGNKENLKIDSEEFKTQDKQLDNDQATIQTTDLDKISQDDEKELASPLEDTEESIDDLTSKSPKLNLLDDFVVVADDTNMALLPELEPINADVPKSEHQTSLPETTFDAMDVTSASPIELDKSSPLPREHEMLRTGNSTPEKRNLGDNEELFKDNLEEKEILVQADIHQSHSPVCEPRFDSKSPAVDNEQSPFNATSEVSSSSPLRDVTHELSQPEATLPENVSHIEFEDLTKEASVSAHTNIDQIGLSDDKQECLGPICELRSESRSPVDFEASKSPISELKEAPTDTLEPSFNPKSEVEYIHLAAAEQSSAEPLAASPVPACHYSAEPELCDLAARDAEIRESHSPVDLLEHKQEEEITSSVKDDVSSPIEQLSPMKSPEPLVDESIKVVDTALGAVENLETYLQDESKIEAHTESSMLNEDILSCPRPESNFSTTEQAVQPSLTNGFDNITSGFSEQICIKTDQITMEFAESALLTPSEESKAIDESVQLAPTQSEADLPVGEPEPIQAVQIVEPTESSIKIPEDVSAPAPLPVAPLEVKEAKAEGKKSPTSAKKPVGKVEPRKSTGPSKVGAVKASSKPTAAPPKVGDTLKVPPKAGTTKPASTAPKTMPSVASKTLTKPKTAPAAKPTEKKPPARTEVKPAARTTLARKSMEAPASKTTTRPAGSAMKTSPTKTTAPRPTTAPSATATKTTATAAPPRPTTAKPRVPLTSRTTTTGTAAASKSSSATTNVKTTTTSRTVSMPKTTTAPPKPRTITSVAPKPRVSLTKTVTKGADSEKEKKESANKLTASRSSAGTKTGGVAASRNTTIKRTEIKSSTDRSAATAKTTATSRTTTVIKKSSGEVKTSTKTKTTKIEKPKQNGVAPTNVTEEIKETTCYNVVNESESGNLVKDNSPLDNKLLIETSNTLIDVMNPAD